MIMELNHPGWQDSVENAAAVAVDAAIRAETYSGGDALMMVERAAVEGATKAAKEMEIKAENDGSQGPSEQAVAQRVENSAGECASWHSWHVRSRDIRWLQPWRVVWVRVDTGFKASRNACSCVSDYC